MQYIITVPNQNVEYIEKSFSDNNVNVDVKANSMVYIKMDSSEAEVALRDMFNDNEDRKKVANISEQILLKTGEHPLLCSCFYCIYKILENEMKSVTCTDYWRDWMDGAAMDLCNDIEIFCHKQIPEITENDIDLYLASNNEGFFISVEDMKAIEREERKRCVKNAIANVELEGMKLSKHGYEQAEKYANGEITEAEWITELYRRVEKFQKRR